MKTLHLIKEIYMEGFKNLGHMIVREYFRVFTWISFILFFVALYAFVYRAVTGFAFD
ncbi:MAG: hypothetical protein HKN89_00725 [Eudoraea sp.]|nr:hypothetical protein [Eudoraea sp.]